MKKITSIVCMLAAAACFSALYAQTAQPKVLVVYEEPNEGFTPWLAHIENTLKTSGFEPVLCAAADAGAQNVSSYDYLIVYGAVQAFTMRGPVRDWLSSKPQIAGKKTVLFVTANRWLAGRYTKQLTKLLESSGVNLVDAVSSATKDMTDDVKKQTVQSVLRLVK